MSEAKKIGQNLATIQSQIASAAQRSRRDASAITLVAVTKSVGLDEIRILRDLGITHFGENRVDIAREKIETLSDTSLTWHMIGNVQRRKAKEVLQLFDTIDAIDRISLAATLQRHGEGEDRLCRGLVEVNVSGEAQKHGFSPDNLAEGLAEITAMDRIQIDGLLTMAPYTADREALMALFGTLRTLAEAFRLPVVSMGMSRDFEEAIEAGATQVRIGRSLFA